MNRRQFLSYSALAAGTATAAWWQLRRSNHPPSVSVRRIGLPLAHALRDAQLPLTHSREQSCDTLILGSGAAALSAAWWLVRNGQRNILLAEGFERNGNQAAYTFGESKSSLHAPAGAHYLPQPSAESIHVRQMLHDLGIIQGSNPLTQPIYSDMDLVHQPDERVWADGAWHSGLLPRQDADTQRFFQYIATLRHAKDASGNKAFSMPVALSSAAEEWRRLDRITFAQWLKQQGYQSPVLWWYLDYCCRDDYGQGVAQVSAFAGLHYFAARGNENAAVLTWADGLNHIAEKLRRFIGLQELADFPDTAEYALRQPASVPAVALSVEEQDDAVNVHLRHTQNGKTHLIRAKNVICAMPLAVAKRVLRHAERYGFAAQNPLPQSAPWLVGNFVLRRFPNEAAHTELAWDNIRYGSPALGYVVASHQAIRVAKPEQTIFTAYRALNHAPPDQVRHQLLHAADEDLLALAAEDLLAVYGKSFWRAVVHVDIAVRAHAMAVPAVGYLSNPLLLQLRGHHSRLQFAHSDLSSYSVFEEAVHWGVQAAQRLLG